jgi:hypothetical protein
VAARAYAGGPYPAKSEGNRSARHILIDVNRSRDDEGLGSRGRRCAPQYPVFSPTAKELQSSLKVTDNTSVGWALSIGALVFIVVGGFWLA